MIEHPHPRVVDERPADPVVEHGDDERDTQFL